MKVLIGCPVFDRAWILPDWFAAIEKQTFPLEDIGFIFELGPNDDETHDILWEWHMNHPQVAVFDGQIQDRMKHRSHDEGSRIWQLTDYERMVTLRNSLLDRAILYEPDAYFSLDSDIILENPHTIEELFFYMCSDLDAVSPLCYMTPTGIDYPNAMKWAYAGPGPAIRVKPDPTVDLQRVDIIMAAKMMNVEVYQQTRYRWHKQGEDLGWSQHCYEQDLKLYLLPKVYATHIMHRSQLQDYKKNGDPRSLS